MRAGKAATCAIVDFQPNQETVRSHLKIVLAKTETRRQAELAAMMSSIIDLPSD
jgi:hypothetical protein